MLIVMPAWEGALEISFSNFETRKYMDCIFMNYTGALVGRQSLIVALITCKHHKYNSCDLGSSDDKG